MNPQNVYRLLKQIPRGKVTTYGAVARALKQPQAGRRVGQILKQNPCPIKTHCHRVVRSDGIIGGYCGNNPANIKQKIALLKSEKIEFKNGKVVRIYPLQRFLFTKFLFAFLLFFANFSLAEGATLITFTQKTLPLSGEPIIYTV
ncbi:MAG: MGMT family protein [Candidatus Omnitrophota bacterium]|nr:MGMT family protein [Candidatus Omnitrophota bacterium]